MGKSPSLLDVSVPKQGHQAPSEDLANQKSFNELVINSRGYISRLVFKTAEVLTNVLSTSKGRNKVCSLIQYQAKLTYICHVNSNITEIA